MAFIQQTLYDDNTQQVSFTLIIKKHQFYILIVNYTIFLSVYDIYARWQNLF
jgi:hypothetical protein